MEFFIGSRSLFFIYKIEKCHVNSKTFRNFPYFLIATNILKLLVFVIGVFQILNIVGIPLIVIYTNIKK